MKFVDLLGINRRLVVLGALSMSSFATGCIADNAVNDDAAAFDDDAADDGELGSRDEVVGEAQQAIVTNLDTTIGTILATRAASATNTPIGLAAAVVANGQIYYNVWGNRSQGIVTPVQTTDRFSMGSISKPITGEWIAKKIDAGALSYKTRIIDVLPGLFTDTTPNNGIDVNPHQSATIAHLMSHTGGFAYQPTDQNPGEQYLFLPALPLRRLNYVDDAIVDPLMYPLGTVEVYDGSAVTATSMFEMSLGIAYESDINTVLFSPLGMSTAGFGQLSISKTVVTGVINHSGTPLVALDPVDGNVQRSPVGGVGASVIDMGKFLNYALTSHPNLRETVGRSSFTPLGWIATVKNNANGLELSHSGSDGTYRAVAVVWPARGLAFVVATNSNNSAVLSSIMADLQNTATTTWGAPGVAFPEAGALTYQIGSGQVTPSAAVNAFDGDYSTSWTAPAPTGTPQPASLTVALSSPSSVSGVVLNEAGPFTEPTQPPAAYFERTSQAYRVEHFNLWLWKAATSTWILAASGDSMGPKKAISFGTTFTGITKARLELSSSQSLSMREFHLLP